MSQNGSIEGVFQPSISLNAGLNVLRENTSSLTLELCKSLCEKADTFLLANEEEIAEKYLRWGVGCAGLLDNKKLISVTSYLLSKLLDSQGHHLDAVHFYKKALLFFLNTGNHKEICKIYYRIAVCYSEASDAELAIKTLEEGARILGGKGYTLGAKKNLFPFLNQLLHVQQRVVAANEIEREISICKERLSHIEAIRDLLETAAKCKADGKIKDAIALYEEAESTIINYADDVDKAAFHLNFGATFSDAGRYNEATQRLQTSLCIFQTMGDFHGIAVARKNLASNYEDQGYYQKALDQYRQALEIFEELSEHKLVARTLNELGVLHKNLNLFMDAVGYFLSARHYFRSSVEAESMRMVLGNLDTLFTQITTHLCLSSVEDLRELFDNNKFVEMARLLEAGMVPWERVKVSNTERKGMKQLSESARKDVNYIVKLAQHHYSHGNILQATQELSSAALTYKKLTHDYPEAIDLFYEAAGMCEEYGLDHLLLNISNQLGKCLLEAEQFSKARDLFEDLVDEAKQRDVLPILYQARINLSEVYDKLEERNKALHQLVFYAKEIEERARTFKHIHKAGGFLSDKMIGYQRMIDIQVQQEDAVSAYETVLRAKAWPFVSFFGQAKNRSMEAIPEEIQKKLNGAKHITNSFLMECGEREDNNDYENTQWVLEREELRIWNEAVEQESKSIKHNKNKTLKSIQANIDGSCILIDFFFTETKLCIFAITEQHFSFYPIDITQKEIFQKISECGFLAKMAGTPGVIHTIGQVHMILQSLLSSILRDVCKNYPQVCFCLHGLLHLLPINITSLGLTKRETASVSSAHGVSNSWLIPHAAFFCAKKRDKGALPIRFLGIGNPDQSLPFAGKEIEIIENFFEKKYRQTFVNREISRDVILDEIRSADVVHFACHGLNRDDIPELSYLKLGKERLRTIDIINRGYTKAKLVVLSACWTSIGRVDASDEISSLARAFLFIGAEFVIATLWPISDRKTLDFMAHFYDLWFKKNTDIRTAFNATQKAYFDSEAFSSAFVLLEGGELQ